MYLTREDRIQYSVHIFFLTPVNLNLIDRVLSDLRRRILFLYVRHVNRIIAKIQKAYLISII